MNKADTAELSIEPAGLQGLEVADLVADWNAGEQIDITLLLEQFTDASEAELVIADLSPLPAEMAGDVIVLDFTTSGALTALYDDLAMPSPHI